MIELSHRTNHDSSDKKLQDRLHEVPGREDKTHGTDNNKGGDARM